MIGLLLKDFYIMRQYGRTMLAMLVLFAFISAGMDNPATFFVGFIVFMSMMMTVTTFSYDAQAKWDRYALSMPITRKEIVAEKYLFSVILCLGGAIVSFLISLVILKFSPAEDFGMKEHFYVTVAMLCFALFFSSILLPLIYKFDVEKSRILLVAIFAVPTGAVIALSKMGVTMPAESTVLSVIKLLPALIILVYILSFYFSVRIFSAKEI